MKNTEIKKYTVKIEKNDGMMSEYFVAATSAGGAEETALREVYAARYAVANIGWPECVKDPDLISRGAAIIAVRAAI